MTTKTHALRLPAKVTESIVKFTTEYAIDLNTVDEQTAMHKAAPRIICIGEKKCGYQVLVTEKLLSGTYRVGMLLNGDHTGEYELVHIEEREVLAMASGNKEILTSLQVALESLKKSRPTHHDFIDWDEFNEPLTKSSAYEEASVKYDASYKIYSEKLEALEFAIEHYGNKVKLDMAHAIIGLKGE